MGLWLNTKVFDSWAEMDPGSCTDSQVGYCSLLVYRLSLWAHTAVLFVG